MFKILSKCPCAEMNRVVLSQESLKGKSKHKISAPGVSRLQQRHMRKYMEIAAILNWFSSEHLHHSFVRQDHHWKLKTNWKALGI